MPPETRTSKKEITHERILDAAARAIRRSGYAGASVADVMKEAGLTHGGFYAHFPSREEMIVGALDHAGKQSSANLRKTMAAAQKKSASPFRALIEAYLSVGHMAAPETGCVVAALGSEMPRQSDAVCQAAGERVRSLIRTVESALPAGVAKSEAPHIASAMVGGLQLARALGGTAGKELLAANRQALLDRYE